MPVFGFVTAGAIRFGRGVASEAVGFAAARGRRALVVHGATAARADWLVAGLERAGLATARIACAGEPALRELEAAVATARAHRPDVILSLGGGAAIDLGKAVAALSPVPGPALDYLEVVGKGRKLESDPLPFVAMPTTAGTGAEVTKNAVIGVPESRRKVSLRDDRMLPDLALVDPALTDGLPKAVTLACGLDAVTQVIEPYVSARANPLTDAICRAAIPEGLAALMRLMEGEDADARERMAWVSLSGGLALANSGLGAVHGLAGVLGGRIGGAHGAICGLLLPHVIRANMAAVPEGGLVHARLLEVRDWIATAMGVPAGDALDALAGWMVAQGLPTLGGLGVGQADLQTIADDAAASSSMKANPVPLPAPVLVGALRAAL
ncbi:iron-containing alcohol dehydrogenase [Halovulum dunhuangense]|uniref:iron-containing alcohol dehydrogenase n=1 Tax=Halovulum dunhuangense TaxID=1505036 RepID=UPI003CCD0FB9